MSLWMLQTETSHLWKVRYPIILLGWLYKNSLHIHTKWATCHSDMFPSSPEQITYYYYASCSHVYKTWIKLLELSHFVYKLFIDKIVHMKCIKKLQKMGENLKKTFTGMSLHVLYSSRMSSKSVATSHWFQKFNSSYQRYFNIIS